MPDKWIRTACPRNCYSSCGFFIGVTDGRVSGYAPDPENAATPEGMCLKGQAYLERVYARDRLLYPMHRNGKGSYDRISWKEAVDEIVMRLKEVVSREGPQAVLYYTGSGMSGLVNDIAWVFWQHFGGVTTTYGNLCWPAGLEATRLTLGEVKHNVPWDLGHARLIIMWGKNAAETNIQEMVFVEKAIEKGAELIVIDPRRTPTADKAHLLIQPKPGTDGALALGVARILIHNGQIDQNFIDQHVLGFEEFKDAVADYTVAEVERITGVPSRFIVQLAEKIGTISPVTLLPGFGLQRYSNGGQTIRSLLSLLVITGNIGKKGACWHYANLQSYIFDRVKEPLSYYPPENAGKIRYSISKTRLGSDMLTAVNPPILAAWVERGNPLTQNPDSHTIKKAFRNTEFVVVVEQFLNDTAAVADIVLPAKSMFEQSDIIGSYWNPYIQYKPLVIPSPGEVKSETEIYHLLAAHLWPKQQEARSAIPANNDEVESWLKERVEQQGKMRWSQLLQGPVIPENSEHIAFSDFQFKTPSGRIELFSKQAKDQWNVSPLPSYVSLEIPAPMREYPLFLQTPNTKNRIHSQFGNLRVIRDIEGDPHVDMNPDDARKRGLVEGDTVRLFNNQGEIFITLHIDYGLLPGVVSIPNGFWHSEGAGVNVLSFPLETDMGYGAAFHNTKVDVVKKET